METLPRALTLSTLIFGDENHHVEMRCRLVEELVKNRQHYIEGLGMGATDADRSYVTRMLSILADKSGLTAETASHDDIDCVLKNEMSIRNPKAYMGLWQVAAAANVLCRPVVSLYPEKGWEVFQHLNNRTLHPRQNQSDNPVFILWTSARQDVSDEHWTANHFVPLLPASTNSTPVIEPDLNNAFLQADGQDATPALNNLYLALWQGKNYVARVDAIDADIVLLNFMSERDGLFSWPSTEDTSWEHASALQRPVELQLVASRSSQRNQYYRIC